MLIKEKEKVNSPLQR